ncbi:TPA: flagellar hook-length control protein FliK [Klebsiella aerogenes]|uniref:flagellar hook-length control protein FliK n=1 Tax=Klebsiella aerogenes TaxID=548 RepID=UPI0021AEFDA1|nr:flagellar hook-length control protein FliK [Klebsiella aerogenes]MCT4773638.1 flagellar hook-length control protein FliK [Klebsiella aerogenes]MEB7619337.1 flagellar hook-length control protein FliK [Klebsiella aerogenes]HBT3293971.1 flagellar hook-length control protein FliK [Klebsiella aerogenes]HDT0389088.1 flagellar hook-length control protein FliK [Klebsiella aerogenes]HDU4307423.1 flagellar hook-length control protein FliK [Klebsiella aerogenes]
MNLNALPALSLPGDASALADLALDDAQLSSAFAQLLGARFTPAQSGTLPPAALSADDESAPPLSRNQLNQLLAALGERGALLVNALPASAENAVDATAKKEDTRPDTPPLSEAKNLDPATLQALYAMLPAAIVAPPPQTALPQAQQSAPSGDKAALRIGNATIQHVANLPEGEPAAKPQPGTDPLSGQNLPSPVAQTAATPQHDMAERPAENTPSQPAAVAFSAASPSQSATPASALVTAPPTPQLNAQLGSPEWQQALSQQVLMFHRNGQQSAELRLHPQELGALQITLQLDDKQAQLHIASAHGQVRAAVEAAMPQLRHALAESGINLGQSSVGGEATPQWQQQNGNGEGRASYAERHGGGSDAAPIEPVSAPAALQRMANQLNGVDIFA